MSVVSISFLNSRW